MTNVTEKKKNECCGCGACEAVCPTNAIQMRLDEAGFFYPEVEKSLCVGCEKCICVCGFVPRITHNQSEV